MNNKLIDDIRKKQDEMILMINATFEEIIKQVSTLNTNNNQSENEFEILYPITNVGGFKGKKVIAVILHDKRWITPTWKKVVEIILKDAIKNPTNLQKLNDLCDKLLGRVRNRLAHSNENMRSALQLSDNLYIETHYDTETLMRFLLQILNEINYDYSHIKIAIKI